VVDVFEQVEEELRSDRYKRLARTWLPIVGGLLLIALIAALAWWGWQSLETSKADKASIAYERGLESLEANNPTGADAAFKQAAEEGNGAYKAMALMQRAGVALEANRTADALAHLDEAARSTRDPLIADAAALKAAWVAMDSAPLADLESRLTPLIKDGRPYSAFAAEALAMARLQHGQADKARESFVLLKNGLDTPPVVARFADLAISSIDAGGASNLAEIARAQAALPGDRAPTASVAPEGTSQPPAPSAPTRP
jgi:hypothetical protein